MYKIEMTDNLQLNLQSIHKKVRTRLIKESYARLRNNPEEPPEIKKLRGWKDVYRLKILQDYRAIYRVDRDSKVVTLLIVGHRSKVYEQLGHDMEKDQPSARIIANEQAHLLLERRPEPEEFGQAYQRVLNEPPPPEPGGTRTEPLPANFDSKFMDTLDIEPSHRSELLKCRTAEQLLNCPVPDPVKEKKYFIASGRHLLLRGSWTSRSAWWIRLNHFNNSPRAPALSTRSCLPSTSSKNHLRNDSTATISKDHGSLRAVLGLVSLQSPFTASGICFEPIKRRCNWSQDRSGFF